MNRAVTTTGSIVNITSAACISRDVGCTIRRKLEEHEDQAHAHGHGHLQVLEGSHRRVGTQENVVERRQFLKLAGAQAQVSVQQFVATLSPPRAAVNIAVELSTPLSGQGATRLTGGKTRVLLAVPSGMFAGQSQSKTLQVARE